MRWARSAVAGAFPEPTHALSLANTSCPTPPWPREPSPFAVFPPRKRRSSAVRPSRTRKACSRT
jgi:hypothetical protein